MRGTVVLDLSRMRKILEVNARFGYCAVEPGVGFFDLYEHLQANKDPLWMAVPGNAWGSVLGNAVDRGNSPFRSAHARASAAWSGPAERRPGPHRHGGHERQPHLALVQVWLRPSWDQTPVHTRVQSRGGHARSPCGCCRSGGDLTIGDDLPKVEDVAWATTILSAQSQGSLQQNPSVVPSWKRAGGRPPPTRAVVSGGRPHWPEFRHRAMLKETGLAGGASPAPLWRAGSEAKVHARVIADAFAQRNTRRRRGAPAVWKRGDPTARVRGGQPVAPAMQMADWRGGRGAHLPSRGQPPTAQRRCASRCSRSSVSASTASTISAPSHHGPNATVSTSGDLGSQRREDDRGARRAAVPGPALGHVQGWLQRSTAPT